MKLHLGKLPATKSPKDLRLSDFLAGSLPSLPPQFGHEDKMPLPRLMLGNGPDDSVAPGFQGAGNCVFAAICNLIRLAAAIGGTPARFTGKEAIAAYSAVTGYKIGDDSTDQGTDVRTALNWWRKTGITDADGHVHKLGAFAAINLKAPNLQQMLQALYVMDVGVLLGINFPSTAMGQFNASKPWAVVKGAKSEGGHAIVADALRGNILVESWARDQQATTQFIAKYADEAWAVFPPEMLVNGRTMEGLDLPALQARMASFSH